jgi:hypothetical protein
LRAGLRSTVGPDARRRPVGNELRANDPHSAWSVDPQPHLPPLEPDNRDANVVTDEEFFRDFPRQNQHVWFPQQVAQVHFPPTFRLIDQFVSRFAGKRGSKGA